MQDKKAPDDQAGAVVDASYDLRRRSITALGGNLVVVVLDRVIQILLLAVVARLIVPEETAVSAAALVIVTGAWLISSFGVPPSLIQSPSLDESVRADARGSLTAAVVLVVILVQFLAPLAGQWFKNPEVTFAVRLLALSLLAQPIAMVAVAILSRGLRARDIALADLISSLGSTAAITIPLAFAGFGWRALIYGGIAQTVLRAILLCVFSREIPRYQFDWRRGLALYRRGSGFFLNGAANYLSQTSPKWIIGRALPSHDLGLFTRAQGLAAYPTGLFGAIAERVFFPAVALVQDQGERLKSGILHAVQINGVIGLPLAVALTLLSRDVIMTVLGEDWLEAAPAFTLLAATIYFRLAERLNWVILRGVGRPYELARSQGWTLGVVVLGCVAAAPLGLTAVAAVVTGATVVSFALTSMAAMRAAGITLAQWTKAHGPGLIAAAMAAGVLWPLTALLQVAGLGPYLTLASSLVAGGIVGGLAVFLAPKFFLGEAGLRLLSSLIRGVSRSGR